MLELIRSLIIARHLYDQEKMSLIGIAQLRIGTLSITLALRLIVAPYSRLPNPVFVQSPSPRHRSLGGYDKQCPQPDFSMV